MKTLAFLAILLLAAAGCIQTPPTASNNTTNITPPANNTTAVPPGYEVKDYCQKDADCVRLNKCCDCGLGEYVNTYNQKPECPPGEPRCMCPIALSKGICQSNRCVAAAENATVAPPDEAGLSFHSGQGECGAEIAPARTGTEGGIALSGAVGGGSVCRTAAAELARVDGYYVLNISTRAIPGVAACIMCLGAIPWEANITGFRGRVEVYYDGRKVFPASSGFCGTSTNGTCSTDADCVSGGCSGQVCQSASEPPVITTCEYTECYDAQRYGVGCGCHDGKCRWQ
jgi:eight-cysteine-cluster-containing protein